MFEPKLLPTSHRHLSPPRHSSHRHTSLSLPPSLPPTAHTDTHLTPFLPTANHQCQSRVHFVLPAEQPIDKLQPGDDGPDHSGQSTCIGYQKFPVELVRLLQHLGLPRVDSAQTRTQNIEHKSCLNIQLSLACRLKAVLALEVKGLKTIHEL